MVFSKHWMKSRKFLEAINLYDKLIRRGFFGFFLNKFYLLSDTLYPKTNPNKFMSFFALWLCELFHTKTQSR